MEYTDQQRKVDIAIAKEINTWLKDISNSSGYHVEILLQEIRKDICINCGDSYEGAEGCPCTDDS